MGIRTAAETRDISGIIKLYPLSFNDLVRLTKWFNKQILIYMTGRPHGSDEVDGIPIGPPESFPDPTEDKNYKRDKHFKNFSNSQPKGLLAILYSQN